MSARCGTCNPREGSAIRVAIVRPAAVLRSSSTRAEASRTITAHPARHGSPPRRSASSAEPAAFEAARGLRSESDDPGPSRLHAECSPTSTCPPSRLVPSSGDGTRTTRCESAPSSWTCSYDTFIALSCRRSVNKPRSEGARAFPPPLAANQASFGDSPMCQRRQASGALPTWHRAFVPGCRRYQESDRGARILATGGTLCLRPHPREASVGSSAP